MQKSKVELSIECEGCPGGLADTFSALLQRCCEEEGIPHAAIAFGRIVGEAQIRALNREFRGIDRPTDVLSFPSIAYPPGKTAKNAIKRLSREKDPDTGLPSLGDFAICLPTAARQATEFGHSLLRELCYLAAHSLFHLMGYDHMDAAEKATMRTMEERVMAHMQLQRD